MACGRDWWNSAGRPTLRSVRTVRANPDWYLISVRSSGKDGCGPDTMEPTAMTGRCHTNRKRQGAAANSGPVRRRQAEEMANPFVKFWKYLMAAFSSKIDEHADPKVQIQQAIEEAQRAHQALSQQAAAVIGNQRQLEMKLNRQLGEVEKLQSSARQALVMADQARAEGDSTKAGRY